MAKDKKMTVNDALGELIHSAPFQPFDIKMADGDTIHVEHPDFIARSPIGDAATVYEREGHLRIVHLNMVVTVEPTRPKGTRKPGTR